jgi:hypothetical protein
MRSRSGEDFYEKIAHHWEGAAIVRKSSYDISSNHAVTTVMGTMVVTAVMVTVEVVVMITVIAVMAVVAVMAVRLG